MSRYQPRHRRRPWSRRGGSAHGQRGAIAPLIFGFVAILLLLVSVVVAASKVFLFRQELSALADGAALAAADGIDTSSIYEGGGGDVVLSQAAASHLAGQYLAASGADSNFPGFHSDTNVVGPTRVRVTVGASCHLPIISAVTDQAVIPVSVTAEAQTQRR